MAGRIVSLLAGISVTHYYFQSYTRNVDLVMVRQTYRPDVFLHNDYLFHVGGYRLCIVTAAPKKLNDYRTVINPFDGYVWALVGSTMALVVTSFILIDKIFSSFMAGTVEPSFFLSM